MNAHKFFLLSVFIKLLEGLFESVIGVFLYFFPATTLNNLLNYFVRIELGEDPDDWLMTHLVQNLPQISIETQNFLAFYLFSHGLVKLVLVYSLLKKHYWAYPIALVVFTLFTIYQVHLYLLQHSPWMIALIIMDILVVILTSIEYKHILSEKKNR